MSHGPYEMYILSRGNLQDPFCGSLSAQDRIFHRVVIPAAVAAGGEDVAGFEVVDEILKMRLAMLIENHVGGVDIEHMPGEDTVAFIQDSASLQINNGFLEHLINMKPLLRLMRDLDIHRARAFRRHRLREIHREADARENELILREVDPMLVVDVRPVDADVDVQHRDGMKPLSVGHE